MTTQPSTHRAVIAAALEDWWITTDPLADYDYDAVAETVDAYLISSGYHIAPTTRTPRMPISLAIIIVLTAASTGWALDRGDWWWAAIGAIVIVLLADEAYREIRDRRQDRS